MLNKLGLFGGELKHSLSFVIIALIEITISIFLLNMALTLMYSETVTSRFYSSSVADYSSVSVYGESYAGGDTVSDIGEDVDLSTLATIAELGQLEKKYYKDGELVVVYAGNFDVITPSLIENFDNLGVSYDFNNTAEYYEAFVCASTDYELGKVYDINFQIQNGSVETISIMPIEYFNDRDYYYRFGDSILPEINAGFSRKILICDDVTNFSYATIQSGIFVNDNPPSYYENIGFEAETVQHVYDLQKDMQKELGSLPLYMAIVIVLYTCVSIFCLYLINVNKSTRKRSVNYICGVTPRTQLVIEIAKMGIIFSVAFFVNLGFSLFLGSDAMYRSLDIYWLSMPQLWVSTAIMLAVYCFSIIIGLIKYIKANTVQIINNEH